MFKGIRILKFLDNVGFNRFREVSLLPKVDVNQKNNQKQQDNQSNFFKNPNKDTFEPSFKRLNDLDTEIINKNLYKFLPVDSLRIELQLEMSEKRMKEVETDMKVLSFLGVEKESEKFAALEQKKQNISKEILQYRQEYRELGVMYKVTDSFADLLQKTKNRVTDAKVAFMGSSFISTIKSVVPAIKAREEIKQTLNNSLMFDSSLSSMLSTTVTPFGENEQRFKEFAHVMTKANGLDFKISKLLNTAKVSGSKLGNAFKTQYEKAITGINDLKQKIQLRFPKKTEQENFFATLAKKAEPPS